MKILKQKDLKECRENLLKFQFGRCGISHEVSDNFVLDHDHTSNKVRKVLDRDVNQFLGKVESNYKRFLGKRFGNVLPFFLKEIANYLELNYSQNPYHPAYIKREIINLKKMNKFARQVYLETLGISKEEANSTLKNQIKLLRKYLNSLS